MEPNIAMDHTVVAVHHQDEVVHVMVDIKAPEAPDLERAPLDVVLVLDRSGSMGGGPLQAVTQAAADVLRLAHPQDRIGVVTFDNDADMVLQLDHRHGDEAVRTVRDIRSGGSTNLSGGWLKAVEMLNASPREKAVRRIIVLTDGRANAGISDGDRLAELVTTGHGADITTSFIGFGRGFDEDLLESLADAGQGNNYFCESADQASAVFTTEFNGLAAVVAQNISVEVAPGAPVASATALNDFPRTDTTNGGFQIKIGDAYSGETRRVVVGFHLRPQTTIGALDIAELTLRWTSVVGVVEMHTVTVPVSITVGSPGEHDAGADPRVRDEVVVLQAARDRREARRLADLGEFDAAANVVQSTLLRLQSVDGQSDTVRDLQNQLDRLRTRNWDTGDSKSTLAMSRAMYRKRHTMIRPEEDLDDDSDSTS
jgi:Ca-activated chloride channel family protein